MASATLSELQQHGTTRMTDPASDLTDSRGHNLRVPIAEKIRLRFDGQSGFIVGGLVDLSVGGMALDCGFEATLGTKLRFAFQAPGSATKVSGQGSVVWKRPSLQKAGKPTGLTALGVKFAPLAEIDREEVLRIVRAQGGLKHELEQADAEVTRLRLVSEKVQRSSSRQLEAMRQSVQENARARLELEDQLHKSGEFDLGAAEELLDLLGKSSADSEPGDREDGRLQEKLRVEIDTLKATVAELEARDARGQLQDTTFLWEAAELRVQELSRSQRVLEGELEEAKKAAAAIEGAALVSTAESCAALQLLALETVAEGALFDADERYRRLESAQALLEEEKARLEKELSDVRVSYSRVGRWAVDLDQRLGRSCVAEGTAALQVLALETVLEGALTDAGERYRRLESARRRLECRLVDSAAVESSAASQIATLEELLHSSMSEGQATQGREASDAHIWGEDGAEVFEDQKDQRATRLRWIALLAPGRLGRVLVAGALILTALAILDSPPTSKPVSVAGRPGAGQIAEATSAGQPTVVAAEQTEPEASVPEAADREEAQLESPSPHKEPVQVAASELDRDRAPLEAVLLATESWARAWSEQRLDDYLASYSPDFTPPLSLDLAAWKSERRRRLLAPRYIGVTLNEVVVEVHDDSHASASFLQTYESNSYADVIRKTLSWIREGASWKIVAEKRP